MKKKKSATRHSRPLITGYLERISSRIFSDFPKQLTNLIGRQHGVYALYKGNRLYYVGLATNLRGRIKHHLRDKHAGKWDKFSLYLIRKADHIKELEAIVMMVSNPAGNTSRSRLPQAENLKADLFQRLKTKQEQQLFALVGGQRRRVKSTEIRRSRSKTKSNLKTPPLAKYIKKRLRLRGQYKGKLYEAVVNKSGTIRFNGSLYNSPSSAGKAARQRSTNGWVFWKFKNDRAVWVKLDELRR